MVTASLFWDANMSIVTDAVKIFFSKRRKFRLFPTVTLHSQHGTVRQNLRRPSGTCRQSFPLRVLLLKTRQSKIVNRAVVTSVDNFWCAAVSFQFYRPVIEVAR